MKGACASGAGSSLATVGDTAGAGGREGKVSEGGGDVVAARQAEAGSGRPGRNVGEEVVNAADVLWFACEYRKPVAGEGGSSGFSSEGRAGAVFGVDPP